MESLYHVPLDETQVEIEKRVEALKDTDVLLCGPDDFKELFLGYLKDKESAPIKQDKGSAYTGIENPSILVETSASFCTLMLAFTTEGEAMLLHHPLTLGIMAFAEDEDALYYQHRQEIENINRFAKKENGTVIVTGTNVTAVVKQRILKELFRFSKPENVIPVFTPFPTNRTTSFIDEEHSVSSNRISDVCFIPRGLTKDDRNKIILVSYREEGLILLKKHLDPKKILEDSKT